MKTEAAGTLDRIPSDVLVDELLLRITPEIYACFKGRFDALEHAISVEQQEYIMNKHNINPERIGL